ncbi:hypothetical protein HanRHA438_Chr02g0058061 [Helianthus annuus]|nr:hypothetical protein HanRHA438_Chr02g0058061 [Helianthus annuus]
MKLSAIIISTLSLLVRRLSSNSFSFRAFQIFHMVVWNTALMIFFHSFDPVKPLTCSRTSLHPRNSVDAGSFSQMKMFFQTDFYDVQPHITWSTVSSCASHLEHK